MGNATNNMAVAPEAASWPDLPPGVQVDQAANVTFGGLMANIGGHGFLFDPIRMLSVKRLMMLMCCPDCVMPFMKYTGATSGGPNNGARSYEFHERKSCCGTECNGCFQPPSCCKKGYYVAMEGTTSSGIGRITKSAFLAPCTCCCA